jgi:hypothetical protein
MSIRPVKQVIISKPTLEGAGVQPMLPDSFSILVVGK